jgi:hypothetical protein
MLDTGGTQRITASSARNTHLCVYILLFQQQGSSRSSGEAVEGWWSWVPSVHICVGRQHARSFVTCQTIFWLSVRMTVRRCLRRKEKEKKSKVPFFFYLDKTSNTSYIQILPLSLSRQEQKEGEFHWLTEANAEQKQKNERWWDNIIILQRKGPASPT